MIVAKLQYLRKELTQGRIAYFFYSSETISPNIKIAGTAAMGLTVPTIRELDFLSERFIWTTIRKERGEEYDYNRKMLVIDTGNYPHVIAYIDERDQTPDDNSQFGKDVYQMWLRPFDGKSIPTIMVNMNIAFTGLKLIS